MFDVNACKTASTNVIFVSDLTAIIDDADASGKYYLKHIHNYKLNFYCSTNVPTAC